MSPPSRSRLLRVPAERLRRFRERRRSVDRAPTVPAWHVVGGCWHPPEKLRPAATQNPSDEIGERIDVDGLDDVAGEPRRRPATRRRHRVAGRSPPRPGCATSAARPPSSRAASVPSRSGRRRSIRMTSGRCSDARAMPSAAVAASSVRNPAGRSTSRASFRFRSLSSTIRTSGWVGHHRRILRPCPSASCLPKTTTSSVKASDGCSTRSPGSRSWRSAGTSTRCSRPSIARSRTWWSPTSGCRRVTPMRGSRPPSASARRTPVSASSS